MPESVSGSRWERHRIKIKPQPLGRYPINKSGQAISDILNAPKAEWQDCPGCPKCLPNDGLVLRMSAGRPTRSHEYIFLLTKSDSYYFNSEAVRENYADSSFDRYKYKVSDHEVDIGKRKQGWITTKNRTERKKLDMNPSGRNIRSVWTITTKPFKDAHFATFPPELPKICIKAGTSEKGVCPKCGSPWVRIIDKNLKNNLYKPRVNEKYSAGSEFMSNKTTLRCETIFQTIGWRPLCKCNAGKAIPSIVFDPFAGAGTTGMVAKQLGRNYILIDIKPEYCEMARKRISQVGYQMEIEERLAQGVL